MIAGWWIKPLAYALVMAALLGGVAAFSSHERGIGFAEGQLELKTSYDRGYAQATALAAAKADQERNNVESSHARDLERTNLQVASGLAARTQLDRLRASLARVDRPADSASAAPGPGADDGAAVRGLLGACAERYADVAADAGRFATQVIGLQGYVHAACPGAEEIGGDSPVGERSRAGFIGPAAQPTTGPSSPIHGGVAPP